ncbi:MAG TPA: fibronectin type III domain-containing protein [Gammaproteobacteria bacterium]
MSMKLFRYITLLSLTGILMACSGASENSEALSLIDTSRDSNSTGTEIIPDTTAPTTPTNLQATNIVSNAVQLQWTASTDNVAVSGYRIYRNSSLLNTVTGTSFQDTTVTANTSYQYYVTAFDAANNTNASSTLVVSTPALIVPDTTSPSVPTNLRTSTAPTTSNVALAWNPSTDNIGVSGYRVYRNGSLIATAVSNSYTDNTVSASTSYTYVVLAFDAANNTASSNSLLVNTPSPADTTAPTAPGNLRTSSTPTQTQVSLIWDASTDNIGVAYYRVYRNSTQISQTTNTTYIDSSVAAGTSYSYTVRAYDAAGNFTASSALQVSTAAAAAASASLSWTPPTQNSDDSALTDLTGYVIYYGTSPTSLNNTLQVNLGLTEVVIDNLQSGVTYYFAITAVNSLGVESDLSNIVNKTTS